MGKMGLGEEPIHLSVHCAFLKSVSLSSLYRLFAFDGSSCMLNITFPRVAPLPVTFFPLYRSIPHFDISGVKNRNWEYKNKPNTNKTGTVHSNSSVSLFFKAEPLTMMIEYIWSLLVPGNFPKIDSRVFKTFDMFWNRNTLVIKIEVKVKDSLQKLSWFFGSLQTRKLLRVIALIINWSFCGTDKKLVKVSGSRSHSKSNKYTCTLIK